MSDTSGDGYWVVTQTGHVYAFGDATYCGAPGPQRVLVTSAVRTPDGRGYWILFANGAISPYGSAADFGSPVGLTDGPDSATALFTTSEGRGYWVAAAKGTVADYGDAPNEGSMLGSPLNGSIIAATAGNERQVEWNEAHPVPLDRPLKQDRRSVLREHGTLWMRGRAGPRGGALLL